MLIEFLKNLKKNLLKKYLSPTIYEKLDWLIIFNHKKNTRLILRKKENR